MKRDNSNLGRRMQPIAWVYADRFNWSEFAQEVALKVALPVRSSRGLSVFTDIGRWSHTWPQMPRSFPRGLHCRAEGLCWNASWNQYEPIDIVCQAAAGKIGAAIRGSSTRWQAEWILFADACGKFFGWMFWKWTKTTVPTHRIFFFLLVKTPILIYTLFSQRWEFHFLSQDEAMFFCFVLGLSANLSSVFTPKTMQKSIQCFRFFFSGVCVCVHISARFFCAVSTWFLDCSQRHRWDLPYFYVFLQRLIRFALERNNWTRHHALQGWIGINPNPLWLAERATTVERPEQVIDPSQTHKCGAVNSPAKTITMWHHMVIRGFHSRF